MIRTIHFSRTGLLLDGDHRIRKNRTLRAGSHRRKVGFDWKRVVAFSQSRGPLACCRVQAFIQRRQFAIALELARMPPQVTCARDVQSCCTKPTNFRDPTMTAFPIFPPFPSSGSVPRTITSSVDDVLATVWRVEQVLADRGLPVHSGSSLGALFAKVRRLQKKDKPLTDEQWRRIFLRANEAAWIARAIETALEDINAKEAINRIVRGQIGLSTRQKSLGKDALWELDLYRRIKLGGTAIRFQEPDLVVSLGADFGDYAVACKKIYSMQRVPERLEEACNQILTHGRPGIVAFNLDDLLPETAVWVELDRVALKSRFDAWNQLFVSANEKDFANAVKRGACDGVVVFTSVISDVPNMSPPITVARISAIWNKGASSVAKRRCQAFLECLDRVAHQ